MALRLTTDDVGAAERFSYWRELICDIFVGLDAERPGRGFTGSLRVRAAGPAATHRGALGRAARRALAAPDRARQGRRRPRQRAARRPRARAPGRPRGAAAPRRARALRRGAALHADVRRAVRPGRVPAAARLAGRAPGVARRAHGLARDRAARTELGGGRRAGARPARGRRSAHCWAGPRRPPRRIAARSACTSSAGSATPDSRRRRSPPRTRSRSATCTGCGRRKARRRWAATSCGGGWSAARADLGHGADTVTQVAFRWGFRSPAHFSRAYRGHFGAAPSEHRQVALGQAGPAPAN